MNTPRHEAENKRPNKWLAAVLGFFLPPIGMLYVAQPTWAAVYLVARWVIAVGANQAQSQAIVAGTVLLALAVDVICAIHAYRFAARYPADQARPRYSGWFGALGVLLLAAIPVGLAVRIFVAEPFRVPSSGMLPTLVPGGHIGVRKWGYGHYGFMGVSIASGGITSALHRGDVVVFDAPGMQRFKFTQRVIGLPGDKLVYREDKTLVVNGKEIAQLPQGDYRAPAPHSADGPYARLGETLDGTAYSVLVKKDRPWVYKDAAFAFRDGCVYDDHALTCTVPQGQYFMLGDNRDNSRDSRYFGFVPAANIVGKVAYIW